MGADESSKGTAFIRLPPFVCPFISRTEPPQRTQRTQRELRGIGGSGEKLMRFSMPNQPALLCVLCVLCGSNRFSASRQPSVEHPESWQANGGRRIKQGHGIHSLAPIRLPLRLQLGGVDGKRGPTNGDRRMEEEGFQPGGRKRIAQRFIAGPAYRCGKVPPGRKNRKPETGFDQWRFLSSLRDSRRGGPRPSDKSLGYSRSSFWDFC